MGCLALRSRAPCHCKSLPHKRQYTARTLLQLNAVLSWHSRTPMQMPGFLLEQLCWNVARTL